MKLEEMWLGEIYKGFCLRWRRRGNCNPHIIHKKYPNLQTDMAFSFFWLLCSFLKKWEKKTCIRVKWRRLGYENSFQVFSWYLICTCIRNMTNRRRWGYKNLLQVFSWFSPIGFGEERGERWRKTSFFRMRRVDIDSPYSGRIDVDTDLISPKNKNKKTKVVARKTKRTFLV